jgi:hypothetical protein
MELEPILLRRHERWLATGTGSRGMSRAESLTIDQKLTYENAHIAAVMDIENILSQGSQAAPNLKSAFSTLKYRATDPA